MAKSTGRKAEEDDEDALSISEEEAVLAARQSFDFLVTCMRGEIDGITLGERIHAANAVLTHTTKVPRVLDALLEGAGMLSGDDVVMLGAILE
jgi:hypothetical protein